MRIMTFVQKLLLKHTIRIKSQYASSGKLIHVSLTKKFTIVMIIAFFINLLVYYVNINSIYLREIENSSFEVVQKIGQTYELMVEKAEEIMYQISYNDTKFQDLMENFENSYQYKVDVMSKLKGLLVSNEYFVSCYIYIPKSSIVLTTDYGYSDYDSFYDKSPFNAPLAKNITILPPRVIDFLGRTPSYITILCKMPLHKSRLDGILAINIDAASFYNEIANRYTEMDKNDFLVLDDEGIILMSKKTNLLNQSIFEHINFEPSILNNLNKKTDTREGRIVSAYYSDRLKMNFVMERNVKDSKNKVNSLISYMNVSLFVVFVSAGIIYFSFSKALKPLRLLISRINIIRTDNGRQLGEVESIGSFLNEMQSQNNQLKNQLESMFPIYREKVLQDILMHDFYNIEEINKKIQYFNLEIEIDRYIVITVMVDFIGIEEEEISVKKIALRNLVQGLLEDKLKGFYAEAEKDKLTIALNLPLDIENESQYEMVLAFAGRLSEDIRLTIGQEAKIGIGSFVKDITLLNRSYNESLEALSCSRMYNNPILSIYEIKKSNSTLFVYPFDKEKQLQRFIKIGDYKESCRCLDLIFDEIIKQGFMSDKELKYTVIQLSSMLNKLAYETLQCFDIGNDGIVQNYSIPFGFRKLEDIQNKIREIIKRITERINGLRDHDENHTSFKIIKYINEHFAENIQIGEIADKFGLNRFYIGQLIKTETGKNFNDFINEKKILKAKELLENSGLSIEEIAKTTGFTYSNYFIRIFKKSEGITPGEYRHKVTGMKGEI